jgi:integrase
MPTARTAGRDSCEHPELAAAWPGVVDTRGNTVLLRRTLGVWGWESLETADGHASNYAGSISDTKTEAAERYVPLFESAGKALAETKLRSRFTRPHDFVFATVVGTPLDPGNFVRREFRPALARAGLNFRFHDLRHFAV